MIIFFLDTFNATVYSVGGKNIQDATDEARRDPGPLRGRAARRHDPAGGFTAGRCSGAVVVLYRGATAEDDGNEGDDDVDFDDLAGR